MPSVQTTQFKELRRCYLLTDKSGTAGSTTLSAAEAAGQTDLSVTAEANFVIGDAIRVGDGEDITTYVLTNVAAGVLSIAAPGLKKAYAAGTVVREQQVDEYGPIEGTAGARIRVTRE